MARHIKWEADEHGKQVFKRPAGARADRYLRTTKVLLKTVTPVFGGGVEAAEDDQPAMNDPVTAIRSSSVRNHLRFWWRATAGASIENADELFEREEATWGSSNQASRVDVHIRVTNSPEPKPFDELSRLGGFDGRKLNYVLFPFQKNGPKPAAKWLGDTEFELSLRYPAALTFKASDDDPEQTVDAETEVLTALRAWLAFGGIGARTRRGCGALAIADLSGAQVSDGKPLLPANADVAAVNAWCGQLLYPNVARSSELRPWTTLSAFILAKEQPTDAVPAWKTSVDLYQFFRQGEELGRNPGRQRNRPGRSRWPEPESIREITGRRSHEHGRQEHIPTESFPRAELGLPIIFHFKDRGEPSDTTLYPATNGEKSGERMASPIVIKPLACLSGQCLPIIMPLRTPLLKEVVLQTSAGDRPFGEASIRGKRMAGEGEYKETSPLGELSPDGSALIGFLKLAMENDFAVVNVAKQKEESPQ